MKKRGIAKDAHLWDEVKKTVTPLDHDAPQTETPDLPDLDRVNSRMNVRTPAHRDVAHLPTDQTGLSRRQVRKINTGQLAIDRVIDLHGQSREQAEKNLMRLIPACSEDGLSCLLVITGKGNKRFAQTTGIAAEDRKREDFAINDGVLRAFVPELLARPPLAHYVASVRQSVQKHGGDGAFYVMLRGKARGVLSGVRT